MSSVYDSQYTGEQIDEAVRRSLEFDPNIIGAKLLSSSTANPVDLNTLTTKGKYVINYFINGSTSMNKYSPITIDVYYVNAIMYQSVLMGSMIFMRQRVNVSDFTSWAEYDLLSDVGSGSGGGTSISFLPQVNFTNTSLSQLLLATVPKDTYIKSCVLNLRQQFNGATNISIGTSSDREAFLTSMPIDSFASDNVIFESDVCMHITESVNIYLYIDSEATQGYGNVKLIIN